MPLLSTPARPGSFAFDPTTTAVIVVDMQHDFGHPQGMFAQAGIDISGIQAVVPAVADVLDAARSAGMLVVYLAMAFDDDLSNAGRPGTPNRDRHALFGVGGEVTAPDGSISRVLVRDTWNTAILAELTPQPQDRVVVKHRFSGFFETELDALLRERGIESLIFTGCTTTICVEATLRDAFYRDYSCLLLSDCTAEPIGSDLPRSNHDATLLAVELLLGWVGESGGVIAVLEEHSPPPSA